MKTKSFISSSSENWKRNFKMGGLYISKFDSTIIMCTENSEDGSHLKGTVVNGGEKDRELGENCSWNEMAFVPFYGKLALEQTL